MEINFLFRIYSIVLPIILGVIAAFFLYIGLRVIITKRPFLVSNKWLLWIMFIVITPNILHDLFLPSSTPILIKWLESAIFTVVLMTAPKAKALGFFSSFSVQNFGRWASFAYCDMLLGFYRVFVWLFQLIENSPSDLINLSNVEVAPARGAATGFLLSPN